MKPATERARSIATLGVVALCGAAATAELFAHNSPQRLTSTLWLLALTALLAELLPLLISQRSLRGSSALPYVTALAVAASPLVALLTDVCISLSACALLRVRGSRHSALDAGIANASIAAISCAAASTVMAWIHPLAPIPSAEWALDGLSFFIAYLAVNVLLVTYVKSFGLTTRRHEVLLRTTRFGIVGASMYALIALALCVFIRSGLLILVPLTLLPIIAVRASLVLRARAFEHYYETITALSLMLQRAHPYTHGHLQRVSETAEEVALRLGLNARQARLVREAAVLLDIGKIAVDEAVLD